MTEPFQSWVPTPMCSICNSSCSMFCIKRSSSVSAQGIYTSFVPRKRARADDDENGDAGDDDDDDEDAADEDNDHAEDEDDADDKDDAAAES